jgi:L-alanine-DL-glutamate epimerase-like enolase superfamily enzyme
MRLFAKLNLFFVIISSLACAEVLAQWKIEKVSLVQYDLPRKTAFVTSKGSSMRCPGIFVQVTATGPEGKKLVGLGDILPRSLVTNETSADAWAGAQRMREKLKGQSLPGTSPDEDLRAVRELLQELRLVATTQNLTTRNPPAPHRQLRATLCGYDMALLDLVGQIHNKPIAGLLTAAPRNELAISASTLGADLKPEAIGKAIETLHPSYRAVRLKIGEDRERDLENLRTIAEFIVATESATEIFVDVNGAWKDADTSIARLKEITEVFKNSGFSGRFICEQPTSEEDWDAMAAVTKQAREWNSAEGPKIIIMADESLWDAKDVATLLEKQAADAVNIKIQKAGGLLESFDMAMLLHENAPGVEVYIGGLIMTDICAYANLQLGLAVPRLDYMTGALPRGSAFRQQPAVSPLTYSHERTIAMPANPGLGTALDLGAISSAILQTYPETKETSM